MNHSIPPNLLTPISSLHFTSTPHLLLPLPRRTEVNRPIGRGSAAAIPNAKGWIPTPLSPKSSHTQVARDSYPASHHYAHPRPCPRPRPRAKLLTPPHRDQSIPTIFQPKCKLQKEGLRRIRRLGGELSSHFPLSSSKLDEEVQPGSRRRRSKVVILGQVVRQCVGRRRKLKTAVKHFVLKGIF
jgi:hypothetical protein